ARRFFCLSNSVHEPAKRARRNDAGGALRFLGAPSFPRIRRRGARGGEHENREGIRARDGPEDEAQAGRSGNQSPARSVPTMQEVLTHGIAPGDAGRFFENEWRKTEASGQRQERPLTLEAPASIRRLARAPEPYPSGAAARRADLGSIEQEARNDSQHEG